MDSYSMYFKGTKVIIYLKNEGRARNLKKKKKTRGHAKNLGGGR
jgi:hypothetical protein